MKVLRTSLIYIAGIVLGIAVGLWTASMRLNCLGLCLFGPPRFVAFECALIGALIFVAVVLTALALDRDFPSQTAQSYRTMSRYVGTVRRFLFEDLSRRRES